MTANSIQTLYVDASCHEAETEDCNIRLTTESELPVGARSEIRDALSHIGVDVELLGNEASREVGTVRFSPDGEVEQVNVSGWVLREYAGSESKGDVVHA